MDVFGLTVPTWLVVTLALLIGAYIYYTWNFSALKKLGINGPKPVPVFGNLLTMKRTGYLGFHTYLIAKYGKITGYYTGRRPVILISDPDMLKQIMVKDFHCFENRQKIVFRGILKHGMADQEGEVWRQARNLLTPTFSAGKLKRMKPLLNSCADYLISNIEEFSHQDKEFEAKSMVSTYLMDAVAAVGFGLQMDSQKDPNNVFLLTAKKTMESISFSNPWFYIAFFFPFLVPILEYFNVAAFFPGNSEQFFINFVNKAIDDRKRHKEAQRSDLLQMMTDAEVQEEDRQEDTTTERKKRRLTRKEIIGNSVGFLLAGYDTTSTTLGFLMYNLTVHRHCQDRVIQEIDRVVKDNEPDYDLVAQLEYLQMCIDETLRLFPPPPAAALVRVCTQDVKLEGSDVVIRKGFDVTIPVRDMHYDPAAWDDPEKFDPERFTTEAKAARHQFYYMPFGLGPRHCIAMRLAHMEMKIGMVKVFQRYRLVATAKTEVPLTLAHSILPKAANGIWVKAVAREDK